MSSALLAAFGLLWYLGVYLVRPGKSLSNASEWFASFMFLVPVLAPVLAALLIYGYIRSGRRHTSWVCTAVVLALSSTLFSAQYAWSLLR
ncbi:MAG: hypothetical protein HY299_09575 [Verrucomicrobia bacterium]|nr:hypothetical protein [Verrucomicrobiota bacterium]